jgi:stage V sporulation protein R
MRRYSTGTNFGRVPPDIAEWIPRIAEIARRYGLDFFDTIFEMVDYEEMNQVAALVGFPVRYPHWKFGMEFERLQKSYTYGLHKIYEMVINTDPCYAYLLRGNTLMDQKLVIAHVYAHCDFFKNNIWFSKTNRKMLDEMANHRVRVQRYVEKYGLEVVESFMDACLSIEDLVDPQAPFQEPSTEVVSEATEEEGRDFTVPRLRSPKRYMEDFVNPREYIEEQRKKLQKIAERRKRFPERPTRDVLEFLIQNAPLARWQADVLSIVREESLYFVPQAQTKIMNEGWATFWHSRILTNDVLDDSEVIDFADHHSGTVMQQRGRLNPYKLGLDMFRHIHERWNRGRFGDEYDRCENYQKKASWDTGAQMGDEKIFEVRRIYNDIGFLDTFLDEDFVEENKLFLYRRNEQTGRIEVDTRAYHKVKDNLLLGLTNMGRPFIWVEDANFENRGELLLKHEHLGSDLKVDYARPTLENLFRIWQRPTNLRTIVNGRTLLLRYDGEAHSDRTIEPDELERQAIEADQQS